MYTSAVSLLLFATSEVIDLSKKNHRKRILDTKLFVYFTNKVDIHQTLNNSETGKGFV